MSNNKNGRIDTVYVMLSAQLIFAQVRRPRELSWLLEGARILYVCMWAIACCIVTRNCCSCSPGCPRPSIGLVQNRGPKHQSFVLDAVVDAIGQYTELG